MLPLHVVALPGFLACLLTAVPATLARRADGETLLREGSANALVARKDGRVSCIAEGCFNMNPFRVVEGVTRKDSMLCRISSFAKSCSSMTWNAAKIITQGSCAVGEAKDLDALMFKGGACHEADICSAVAARLGLMLASCGPGEAGSVSFSEVACGKLGNSYMHHGFCRLAFTNIVHPAKAAEMARSLLCACETLSPPGSRSNAIIQRSMDELYILKRIPKKHAKQLKILLHRHPSFTVRHPVLMPTLYFDHFRETVAMPNAFNAEAFGIGATWNSHWHGAAACSSVDGVTAKVIYESGFDVKPKPAKSAERAPFLAMLVRNQWSLKTWFGWSAVTQQVSEALTFLDEESMVDYSLLLAFFRTSRDPQPDPSCMPQITGHVPAQCMVAGNCAAHYDAMRGDGYIAFESAVNLSATDGDCQVVCLSVIDYLMQFSFSRWAESIAKAKKWHGYSAKSTKLWQCIGDLTAPGCDSYLRAGCEALMAEDDVKPAELRWCREKIVMPPIPRGARLSKGCVPNNWWRDSEDDGCAAYAGSLVTIDDFWVNGSQGKTPLEACCVHRVGRRIEYYKGNGVAADVDVEVQMPSIQLNGIPLEGSSLPAHVWKDKGCKVDNDWEYDDDDCIDYEKMEFTAEDWQIKGTGGKTPMEACCLVVEGGKIVYFEDTD